MDGLHRDDEVADGMQWIGNWIKVKRVKEELDTAGVEKVEEFKALWT